MQEYLQNVHKYVAFCGLGRYNREYIIENLMRVVGLDRKGSMKFTKKWKTYIATGLIIASFGMLAAGCGSSSGSADTDKPLIVGTNATFVPFESKDDKTQQLTGFDIDMANAIAQHLHRKVEFKNVTFDSLIPSLNTHDIDMAASGMTITPERAQKVLFSMPYYQSGMAIMVKDNSPIKNYEELAGKTIAVQLGSTGATLAHKIPGAQVKEFNHSNEALLELQNGGADAVLVDLPVAQYYVAHHKESHEKVIPYANTKEYFGFAIAKNNPELQKAVNEALTEMKKDGELNKIYQKWFHVDAPDMPTQWPESK